MRDSLRVAIGAVAGVTGGPATYAVELVRALEALEVPGLSITVLTDAPAAFAETGAATVEVPLASAWEQPWWDNVSVPRALRAGAFDVYHGTKHALPLGGLPRSVAPVVTLHDLAVYAEPETFSLAQRIQLWVHLRHAARVARRVICVSKHAACDVRNRLGVAADRITVVPHGVSPTFRPLSDDARAAVRRSYGAAPEAALVAYVGTVQPRKRIEVAVDAVGRLAKAGRDIRLVVAGRTRPGFRPPWLEHPPEHVRVLGPVEQSVLVDLLGAADVMVSPSSYEGFGLTFAEAMACGTPVVGIDATSVPEVVGDGGLLASRPDAAEVAKLLDRLLEDRDLLAQTAAAALRRADELTWERAARASLEVYRAAQAD